jgi:hypothetical protein
MRQRPYRPVASRYPDFGTAIWEGPMRFCPSVICNYAGFRELVGEHTATPAGFDRNRWLVCVGIDGWFRRNPHA